MTDNDIIKAWECHTGKISHRCMECPYTNYGCYCLDNLHSDTLDFINRQKAKIDDLFCKLTGVMHSVDKWLSVEELKQDEVSRAITMREKTLQIVEKRNAEIERLTDEKEKLRCVIEDLSNNTEYAKAEAVKEFEERAIKNICEKVYAPTPVQSCIVKKCNQVITETVKEMVGEN